MHETGPTITVLPKYCDFWHTSLLDILVFKNRTRAVEPHGDEHERMDVANMSMTDIVKTRPRASCWVSRNQCLSIWHIIPRYSYCSWYILPEMTGLKLYLVIILSDNDLCAQGGLNYRVDLTLPQTFNSLRAEIFKKIRSIFIFFYHFSALVMCTRYMISFRASHDFSWWRH